MWIHLKCYVSKVWCHNAYHYSITRQLILKAVDTIGNCQRIAFTVGVSKHMHKITNLWKFELKYWFKFRSTTMFTISEPTCSIIIKVILVVNRIYKVPYDMYETIEHQWKHRKIEQIKGTRSIFWHSVVPRVKPDDLYMLGSGLGLG